MSEAVFSQIAMVVMLTGLIGWIVKGQGNPVNALWHKGCRDVAFK